MSMTNEELEEALSKALKRITALEKKAAAQHLRLDYLEGKGAASENKTCQNCKHEDAGYFGYPCNRCYPPPGHGFFKFFFRHDSKWEPKQDAP